MSTSPTPEPAAGDDLERRAALLTGAGFWATKAGEGVRSLALSDGPHGVRRQRGDDLSLLDSEPATCFPTGSAIASSWDPELVREVGVALGREADALGVDVLLGPAINVKRSPLGGRNFEYLSEDPYLTGELAAAWTLGVQSTGVGTSLKHFAVNSQETDRMRVSAEVDARTLREIYLPAFERVVREAAPTTVMSSYNAINGVFSSENRWLLTELLREEWGFDGLVVSDWGAVKDRVEALRAGLDLQMPGTGDAGTAAIVAAVRAGTLDRALVDASVERLRRLADRTAARPRATAFDVDAHHALARRAAAASAVLLRNEGAALPLRAGERVAVVGGFAVEPQIQGGGSSHVNPTRVDSPLEELRRALGEDRVTYAAGYAADGADDVGLRATARSTATAADVAVVFAGLLEAEQSEGFDRTHLDLPAGHVAVIRDVAAAAPRTVVVLLNGGVVSLEPWHDDVDAIVEAWTLGQAAGGALADVLTGAVTPAGRLAETIPLALTDTPAYLSFPGENGRVRHGEGVFVGYRYYATTERAVRYAFGHGLSYTEFAHDGLATEATGPDTARVSLTVRNLGAVAGADVVQVYVATAASPVRRPVRELAAFARVHLEPGEARDVVLELGRRAFAFWDEPNGRWRVSPGRYEVQLGRSASDVVARVPLELRGDVEGPGPLSLESSVGEWLGHPVVGPELLAGLLEKATPEQVAASEAGLRLVEGMPMGQFARFPGVEIPQETLDRLIALSLAGSSASGA